MDTVLITGGSGLLALNWALALRGSARVVLGLHERRVSIADVRTESMDLERVDQITRQLDVVQPRIVVHTVALTNVDRCEAEPEVARHVNVALAANVARACSEAGVALVHISTDHLFSGTSADADESRPVTPVNVYGRTKADAEFEVLKAHPAALVVRTNFYGWGPRYRRSFSDTIIDALRAGQSVALFDDSYFTPILASSLAFTVHDLVARGATGIFHVSGDERLSKCEFGLRLAAEFELDARLIKRSTLADQRSLVRRPPDMSLSNRKARVVLQRALGGPREHLGILAEQKRSGWAAEILAA